MAGQDVEIWVVNWSNKKPVHTLEQLGRYVRGIHNKQDTQNGLIQQEFWQFTSGSTLQVTALLKFYNYIIKLN